MSHPYNVSSKSKSGNYYRPLTSSVALVVDLFEILKKRGYNRLEKESAVFLSSSKNNAVRFLTIVLDYIDDLIFLSSSKDALNKSTSDYLKSFEGSEQPLTWYLGI